MEYPIKIKLQIIMLSHHFSGEMHTILLPKERFHQSTRYQHILNLDYLGQIHYLDT